MAYKAPKQSASSEKSDSSSENRIFPDKAEVAATDHIQVLMCQSGYFASKTFKKKANGEVEAKPYDLGSKFTQFEFPVTSIKELSQALTGLEACRQAIVIRGQQVAGLPAEGMVRRTGSGEGEMFTGNFMTPSEGRRWVMVDVDKCVLPKHLRLSNANLPKILDWVLNQLPVELRDVTCHWQLSSSAGVFSTDLLSIHLWFWLTQPVPDAVLKDWANAFNTEATTVKIDACLFRHVQPHYTAKPVFVGMRDPFPERSGLLQKVKAAATIKAPEREQHVPVRGKDAKLPIHQKSASVGFQARLADIGDHPGGRGFRNALLSAAASYVCTSGAEGTDPQVLYEALRARVLETDASAHTRDEIEERASEATIMPMIKSALKKYGMTKHASARKPKFYESIEPHFQSQTMSVEAIQAELSNMLPPARFLYVRGGR